MYILRVFTFILDVQLPVVINKYLVHIIKYKKIFVFINILRKKSAHF